MPIAGVGAIAMVGFLLLSAKIRLRRRGGAYNSPPMILAGVDEAGYGPLLGPLVVGCCAFEVETADGEEQIPCVWKRLGKLVSKKKSASGKKLHINDSKLVYSPADGVKELERSVLAVLCAIADGREVPAGLEALLGYLAGHVVPELKSYPWYGVGSEERFPIEQEGLPIKLMANALRAQMIRSGAICVHLQARVVLERQFNQQLAATRNKASVLFSTSAIHLDYLLRTFGHKPMTIVCDQQGGREIWRAAAADVWRVGFGSGAGGRRDCGISPATRGISGEDHFSAEGGGAMPAGGVGLDGEQVSAGGIDEAV
jgi:hypothetical protein